MNQLKENDEFNRENDDTGKDTSRLGMTKCHEERNVRRHLGKSRSVLRIRAIAEVSFSIQPRVHEDNINNNDIRRTKEGSEQADIVKRPYRRPPSGWGPRRPRRGRPADGTGSARPARRRAGAPPPRPRPRRAGSCSSRRQCRCRGRTCSGAASKFSKPLFSISTSPNPMLEYTQYGSLGIWWKF